jgi:hypothetical protein
MRSLGTLADGVAAQDIARPCDAGGGPRPNDSTYADDRRLLHYRDLQRQAPEGGWGIAGHANTQADIAAAARVGLSAVD